MGCFFFWKNFLPVSSRKYGMALLQPLPAMCFNASGCAVCRMILIVAKEIIYSFDHAPQPLEQAGRANFPLHHHGLSIKVQTHQVELMNLLLLLFCEMAHLSTWARGG